MYDHVSVLIEKALYSSKFTTKVIAEQTMLLLKSAPLDARNLTTSYMTKFTTPSNAQQQERYHCRGRLIFLSEPIIRIRPFSNKMSPIFFFFYRAYVGNKDVAIFEANPVSTCIQLIADHSFSFGHFNKEPNYLIYDSLDCSGQSSTESLEQDYTEFSDHEDDFPMDAEIVYTWEYYDSRSN